MRYCAPSSLLIAAVIFLSTPAESQDRSLLGFLFGKGSESREMGGDRSKRTSSSGDRKGGWLGRKGESGLRGSSKRVEIDLSGQTLRAWEGNRLVLKTRISSGRGGSTPMGRYTAGPYKAVEHYSSLYNNAPMPWSVQVAGNIFIHGFASVPDYPASRGCIRVPVTGRNPARRFFEWVEVGTPIHITY